MGLFEGKKGLVFGIANDRSIAWAITQQLSEQGAEMGFTHLPDRDPARPKAEKRLRKLVDPLNPGLIMPCNVQEDADLDAVFAKATEVYGKIDFVIHAIAFADINDLKGPVYNCSRDGFKMAMEISVFSLMALVKRALPILNEGGNILALTYLGGEKVIPGYNVMGLCKSALESAVEYVASEIGPDGYRLNAVSAGPLKTLAASAVGEFSQMQKLYKNFSPMRRNITHEEVGKSAMFLLSDLASGITGETLHVDAGYHVMGAPPMDFQGNL